jgi:hypothetical protein
VGAALEQLGRQLGEPALDEVEPAARCRREVQLEAAMREQRSLDRRRLVDIQLGGNPAIDGLRKRLGLDRVVA